MDWNSLALTALAQYDINLTQLVFLSHSENVTFRVQATGSDGALFLLRIHSPVTGFRDDIWQQTAVIESELLWLVALRRDTDLVAPYPVQNNSGSFVTSIEHAGKLLNCTLLNWIDGSVINTKITAMHACGVGQLMGKLHQHASVWELPENFVRPAYDSQQLHASLIVLRSACAAPKGRSSLLHPGTISVTDFALLETVAERIDGVMAALEKTPNNWGVIHADLNENNYIFYEGEPRPIDFSCCGFGYYLYDIAYTLGHLIPKNRKSFLSGYQSIRQLPNNYQNILEAFFNAATIINFAFLASQPSEQDFLCEAVPYVIDRHFSRYLKGEPFLFDS